MLRILRHRVPTAVVSMLMLTPTNGALAQTAAQTVPQPTAAVVVPGVVVESATLDKPKVSQRKPTAAAQAAPDPEPEAVSPARKGRRTGTGTGQESAPAPADAAAGPVEGSGSAPGTGATGQADGAGAVAYGVPAEQVGSSVTVVTAAELQARQVRHAADALRSLPGVTVTRSGTPGSLTSVSIRGAKTNQTLVLIDGVDASDTANGGFDLANLLTDDIERIEVLRGGQAGVGDAKAIGGVISITTKGGKGPLTVSASSEGGGFGTRAVSGRVSGGTDALWLSLSAGYRAYDGFNVATQGSEKDPGKNNSVALKGGAEFLPGLTIDFSLRHLQKSNDYDNFFLVSPGQRFVTASDGALFNRTDTWLGGAKLNWETLGGALTHSLYGQFNRQVSLDDDREFPGETRNVSETRKFGYGATLRFGDASTIRSSLTGQIQREEETFLPTSFFTDPVERQRQRLALIGEYRAEIANRFYPTISVRNDDNDGVFKDTTTYRAALSVPLREIGVRPHGSFGTAVKLPTMFELFGYTLSQFKPNPGLTPEQSFNWDAGVEFTLLAGRAVVDVTYFNADLTNKIGSSYDAGGVFSPVNIAGQSTREGIEVAARFAVTSTLSVGGAYTYLDARDPKGIEEVRRAPHAGRIDADLAFDRGRGHLNLAAIYNGQAKDLAFDDAFNSSTVTLKDYWVVNVAASYEVAPSVTAFGRVENLFNEKYQEIYGYQTAGVAAYAGMRFSFSKDKDKP
jgi:vitamin B12 transporter